ncbi:MAG: hypothetical protein KDB88_07590 [Flavobacteriales bacterium]|nr:hypothetical protein [Flavobacteriales bacterium]
MSWDSRNAGVAAGMLAPVIGFILYGVLYTQIIRPGHELSYFIQDLFLGTPEYRAPILSLALIANLPLFFYFDRRKWSHAMRGVLVSMFIYAALIVALWL